jgi:hypothetical protein
MTLPSSPVSAAAEQKHEHENDQDQFHNKLHCFLISGEPAPLIDTTALSTFCSLSAQNRRADDQLGDGDEVRTREAAPAMAAERDHGVGPGEQVEGEAARQ